MRDMQRSIFDIPSATSELSRHPVLRESQALTDARSTLRDSHDNFDRLLERRGGPGLIEDLRKATQQVVRVVQDLPEKLTRGKAALGAARGVGRGWGQERPSPAGR